MINTKLFSVNEIFNSIDGEGVRTGYLVTFIRLNSCNLNCSYCDTMYAHSKQEPNMSLNEILEKVESYNVKRVTITGGEPLIHPYIKNLIENLAFLGYEVNVETNGSVCLKNLNYLNLPGVFVTMDWKCPSSGVHDKMVFENLTLLTNIDVLKFVVGSEEDLEECLKIYKMNLNCYFYISPVFGRMEPKRIVEFMKEHNMVYATVQVQLHKVIWSPEDRGV